MSTEEELPTAWQRSLADLAGRLSRQGGRGRQLAPATQRSYLSDCRRLARWFAGQGIGGPDAVTSSALDAAFRSMEWAPATRRRALTAAREWLAYLNPPGRSPSDLAASPRVTLPPVPRLSQADAGQVIALLAATVEGTRPRSLERALALRDVAIVEVLYGSGLRRAELCALTLPALDFEHEVLMVVGKGGGRRTVPLTEPAVDALRIWLSEGRPHLATRAPFVPRVRAPVFLSRTGRPIDGSAVYRMVSRAIRGVDRSGGPHLLRHAAATHLLEGPAGVGGAHLRVVQEVLGHASIATTQRYTGVTTKALQQTLRTAHPRGGARS